LELGKVEHEAWWFDHLSKIADIGRKVPKRYISRPQNDQSLGSHLAIEVVLQLMQRGSTSICELTLPIHAP
jgi:hypothetical protein